MSKVLIIDDNRHIRMQINLVLKLEGFETIEADNGVTGMEMAKEHCPDLIVCDIVMPELDGYAVLEQLREHGPTSDIPFLFLSAKADRSDVREGMNLGADDYLVKPFTANELVQAISARLNRYKTTRREMARKIESLAQASATKDKFMSIISHDLKSAFSGVMGLSEMLAGRLDDLSFDRLQEISVLMKEAVQSTYNLLESFVEWSRLQANGMQPTIGNINIGEITLNIMMQHSATAAHKNIALSCAIPPDTHIMADANMAQVILRNLVSNALKFTQPGGKVEIRAEDRGETIELSVRDTGVGISEEDIRKLLHPETVAGLHNSKPGTMGEKGTGLGIVFCRELLQKQGSTLHIQNAPGGGAIFSFSMPKS